jgi:hypothetical protein
MANSPSKTSRTASALEAARALVNAMEVEEAPIERCLMLAQRVARLLRDEDAQRWLDLEQRGYPKTLPKYHLGRCSPYALRFYADGTMFQTSLPQLEAMKRANEVVLQKVQAPTITGTAENFTVASATKQVIAAIHTQVVATRNAYVSASETYARLRGGLHRWAADTLISLELGDAAEGIFDQARDEVDAFVRAHVPAAAEQLVAVSERTNEATEEALSHALTSCRRVIASVADAVFPPRDEPYTDGGGKKRAVGTEQYKNRLIAFVEGKIRSGSTRSIVISQLEHLAARLDAVYEKACKGVHADVDPGEARLVVIQTYLFLAEVARYALATAQPPAVSAAPTEMVDPVATEEPASSDATGSSASVPPSDSGQRSA